ncbi:uncharacterized protein V6R79_009369 [Siganus canaliculatus]
MADTALCFTLLTTVSLLFLQIHLAHSQNPDIVDFPQVVPSRQQHFKYDSFSVSCEGLEGLTGWRVFRKINDTFKPCARSLTTSTGPCRIIGAFPNTDSGVYWCEMGGMKRSNTVNISITAGSVVLESPVLPVMEGHDVTLSCRQKSASSNLTAQFFKDGILLESSSSGSITLDSVTKDDEGVYRCQMSGAGESLESWLHVRGVRGEPPLEKEDETTRMIPTHHTHHSAHEEPHTSFHIMFHVGRCLGFIVLVLTLVVTLLLSRKQKAIIQVTNVLLLFLQIQSADSQNPDAVDFPQVVPNRQQHFKYESFSVSCEGLEGLTGWRVLRKISKTMKSCATSLSASTGPCRIIGAFPNTDSGVYWCEMGGMKKSNTVNISITAGSVVLESPVRPVMEGHDVTLSCRQKPASSNLTAQFFKDGILLDSSSSGSITLDGVTKDDEGVYRCQMSGAGESLESWLHVRAHDKPQSFFHVVLPLVLGAGLIVLVLMLVVGLLLCSKSKAVIRGAPPSPPPIQSSISPPREERAPAYVERMYAVVDRNRTATAVFLLFLQIRWVNSQNPDAVDFPQVVPNRQQHFEYESISVSCEGLEGLTGWRVFRMINDTIKPCAPSLSMSTGPCKIIGAFRNVDSGVYWCEMGGMKKSNTVNISVTAGSVVLESPVLPVMEGHDVTLSCRQKPASSNLTAQFFKDGVLLESSSNSTDSITLDGVTKDDEGVYRCQMSGAGESLESWLHVRGVRAQEEPQTFFYVMLHVFRGVGLIVLVLTLVVTVLLYRKRKAVMRDEQQRGNMAAAALCFTLLTTVSPLFLKIHSVYSQNTDVVDFPQVVPNRQQHFEYESFTVSCEGLEGLTGWRVLRKINETVMSCATSLSASTGPCNIPTAFQKVDSGLYWCEMGGMKKSNTVNISITAGSVVLESPVLPVMEGHDVTLSCRQKPASSNLTAQFFKDGILLESSSTGSITLDGVTKDDEAVYHCQMSGAGESLESWLHVRGATPEEPQTTSDVLLPVVLSVGLIVLFLMMLVGLLQCRKRVPPSPSAVQSSISSTRQERAPVHVESTYAVVSHHRRDPRVSRSSVTQIHHEGTNRLLAEVDSCYDVIRH